MARFAAVVTVLEILLSGLSVALFSLETLPDPYLSPDDLREFDLPFESHEASRRIRFEAVLGYDSNVVLLRPRQNAWISLRVDQLADDYLTRRRREEAWAVRAAPSSTTTVATDAGPDDEGFAVRQWSATSARCELVRFKGDRMLVVRVSKSEPLEESPVEELAACERRARLLQARMLQKAGWFTAGRR